MLTKAPRRSLPRPEDEPATTTANSLPGHATARAWTTAGCGMLGAVLLWAAFPPLDLPLLAWLAPAPWLWLVRMPRLPGWRPYLVLWAAGSLHWLLMLEGIRLAHPALYGGWLALSFYLGIYLPVFVGLTRVTVQRLKISVIAAAPVVWVGLELLRGHLITGFSLDLLAHTQAEFPLLIQIADLAGGYALSFAIMLVAACVVRMWEGEAPAEPEAASALARQEPRAPAPRIRIVWWPLAPLAAALLTTFCYGYFRLSARPKADGRPVRVALIQGSLDTVFGVDRLAETLQHYRGLTEQAVQQRPDLDLVVWPESSLQLAEPLIEEPLAALPDVPIPVEHLRSNLRDAAYQYSRLLADEAARVNAGHSESEPGAMLIIGTTTQVFGAGPRQVFNSALLVDRHGQIAGRYYKTHPVMFGEYIPLGDYFPWLYRASGMGGGLACGDGPRAFEVNGLRLMPEVCFESTIPHLVRAHLVELRRRGTPADAIVNVSNDGWFWGHAILDQHFRSNVFRAVENRKPVLVAANTGISAWIDASGVVRQRATRRQPQVLFAEVQANGRTSLYHTLGDWPAWLCAAACVGLAVVGLQKRPAE